MTLTAVIPGSFDPVTRGHVALALRAREIFGRVIVLVMDNRDKKYLLSPDQRLMLCRAAFAGEEGIEVRYDAGMLYEFLLKEKNCVLVKGIRNETDYVYEREMARFNFEHCGVETLFLDAEEEWRALSSTLVRDKMSRKESLSRLVPDACLEILEKIL